jgi:hypothetical protein
VVEPAPLTASERSERSQATAGLAEVASEKTASERSERSQATAGLAEVASE